MKRSVIFSAILILSTAALLAQSGPPSTRFSNPSHNDVARMTKARMPHATIVANVKARPARIGFVSADDMIQPGLSATVFANGRPLVGHGFFFRRSFVHHRAFGGHRFFFRRPFLHQRFFFRRPFLHHRVIFRHSVGRRPFFRARRW